MSLLYLVRYLALFWLTTANKRAFWATLYVTGSQVRKLETQGCQHYTKCYNLVIPDNIVSTLSKQKGRMYFLVSFPQYQFIKVYSAYYLTQDTFKNMTNWNFWPTVVLQVPDLLCTWPRPSESRHDRCSTRRSRHQIVAWQRDPSEPDSHNQMKISTLLSQP